MLICLQPIIAEGVPNSRECIMYTSIQSLFACCMIKACVPAFFVFSNLPINRKTLKVGYG